MHGNGGGGVGRKDGMGVITSFPMTRMLPLWDCLHSSSLVFSQNRSRHLCCLLDIYPQSPPRFRYLALKQNSSSLLPNLSPTPHCLMLVIFSFFFSPRLEYMDCIGFLFSSIYTSLWPVPFNATFEMSLFLCIVLWAISHRKSIISIVISLLYLII